MMDFSVLFPPVLFGLLCSTTLCRLIIFWQMERTPRTFWYVCVFAGLCGLYLVASMQASTLWRDSVRSSLLLALVFINLFDWRRILAFMWTKAAILAKKKTKVVTTLPALPMPPEQKTLKDLAAEDESAILEATKPAVESSVDAA